MKKPSVITANIYKASFTLILALTTVLLFPGCSKNNTTTTPATNNTTTASDVISNSDVTQSVSNAVSGSSIGLASQSETTAQIVAASSLACGQTVDSTISGTSPASALLTYSYDLNYSRTCICSGGTPSQYNTKITGSSSYSVIVMSSVDSTNAQFTVTGVQSSSASYVLNGTYTRTGAIQSLITTQHSFNSTLTFTATNITVSKSSKQITSGSANVQFSGTSLSGSAISQNAVITFLGNNQATVVTGNNTTTINW